MPYQSEAQIIGDEGETWFVSQLPPGWLLQPPKRDVGVDGVIVICDKTDLNGREFRVQVKASKNPTIRDSMIVISDVKRSTIEYWFLSPLPTLIVAYDATNKRGYFRWHTDLYNEVRATLDRKNPKTLSITVPTSSRLDASGWGTIKQNIRGHYGALRESLDAARNAKSLLPTIHALAAAVRQLNSIDHQPIPIEKRTKEQEGILALMEMMQHRLVVATLTQLLSELAKDSEGTRRLETWTHSYSSMVSSVFPNFDKLENWDYAPPDFEIVFAKNIMHVVRYKLMESVLEMIMLLAPGQFNRDRPGR